MNILSKQLNATKKYFSDNYTANTLKVLIVLWALFVIFVTIFMTDDNVILLAAILAYEVLP